MSMVVGSVVFGPLPSPRFDRDPFKGITVPTAAAQMPCNCLGPQPGQTKCPCMLRAESERGRQMIASGVTINGKRYKLVEDDTA